MNKIRAWLEPKFARFVELIAVNGGSININQIGVKPNDSVWKRSGLTIQEAFELNQMVSFLEGCFYMIGNDDIRVELWQSVQREIDRIENKSLIYAPTSNEIGVFGK